MRVRSMGLRRSHAKSGLTVLEVMIALAITSTVLMATASAFSSSLSAANGALERTHGAVFLETVMEDVAAQPFDNLLALNGNHLYDQPSKQHSRYAVELRVFAAAVGLLQIEADLTDLAHDNVLCRVVTLRSRR